MDLCTSCAKTQKSGIYFLEFLCRKAFKRSKRAILLRARRESLGNIFRNASRASLGDVTDLAGISFFPGFWAVWLGSPLREIALQAKYTSKPPGIRIAAINAIACTRGFVIASHPYRLGHLIRLSNPSIWSSTVSHTVASAPAMLKIHSKATLLMPITSNAFSTYMSRGVFGAES